jgi:hypothetical protein
MIAPLAHHEFKLKSIGNCNRLLLPVAISLACHKSLEPYTKPILATAPQAYQAPVGFLPLPMAIALPARLQLQLICLYNRLLLPMTIVLACQMTLVFYTNLVIALPAYQTPVEFLKNLANPPLKLW